MYVSAVYAVGYPFVALAVWLLLRPWPRGSWRRAHPHLIWLRLVVSLLSLSHFQSASLIGSRWAMAKAQADVRTIASAVDGYAAHTGRLPARVADLTTPRSNAGGDTKGPWLTSVPRTPGLGSDYHYEPRPDGTFTVSGTAVGGCGRGTPFTVKVP